MRSVRPSRPHTRGELRNAVRERRHARDLTQEGLARQVGVTRQTIIAVERGGYVPSVALALQLARALSTPLEQLFWLSGTQEEDS